jgi:iron complex outermembrane recepter protein
MPANLPITIVLLLCLAAMATAAPESSQTAETAGEDDTILVTARKRPEDALVVPRSITVIPDDRIRDSGARDVRDAVLQVPNLNLVEFSSRRLSFPFVRGIGSGQGDPAVATYLDGVPQLSIGSTNLPLLDVERIEFLRGPQGTLYGRNALGGLIHVITRRPAKTPRLSADATFGSFDLREFRIRGSLPVDEDRLRVSLAGSILQRNGYTKNDHTGHDVDDRDTLFGRAQILWLPHQDHEVRLTLHAERTRDGGFALSDLEDLRNRPHHIDQDFEGVSNRDIFSPAITWTISGDTLDVTTVASFTTLDVEETSDFDFSPLDLVRRRTEESHEAFTLEARISSAEDAPVEIGEDVTVAWQVGILGFTSHSTRSGKNELRPDGAGFAFPMAGVDGDRGRFRDRGLGLFAHATATAHDALDLGIGIRFDQEWKDADLRSTFESGGSTLASSTRDLDEKDTEILPRFDLAYRFSKEVTAYALAARGFKAGGFNLDAPEGKVAYGPETSWTYETGIKTSLLEDRLSLNAALFYVDWDDMQLSRFDATLGGYVTNAGRSSSRGFELEANARPIDELELFATFGCADTEFGSYVDPYGESARGHDLPFAPRTTWSAGAQWSREITDSVRLILRGECVGIGSYHYDAGGRESESYMLTDFRLAIVGSGWRVDGWVKNAFDEEYVPLAFQANPSDPSSFVGESGAPRTFGITARIEF